MTTNRTEEIREDIIERTYHNINDEPDKTLIHIRIALNNYAVPFEKEIDELNKEVEMLRQERSTYLLSFIEWSKAVDEYGNKLDYADVNNFLTTH